MSTYTKYITVSAKMPASVKQRYVVVRVFAGDVAPKGHALKTVPHEEHGPFPFNPNGPRAAHAQCLRELRAAGVVCAD